MLVLLAFESSQIQNMNLVLNPGSGSALENFTHCKCISTTWFLLTYNICLKWAKRKITKFKIVAAFYGLIVLSNFAILFLVDFSYLQTSKTLIQSINSLLSCLFLGFFFRFPRRN